MPHLCVQLNERALQATSAAKSIAGGVNMLRRTIEEAQKAQAFMNDHADFLLAIEKGFKDWQGNTRATASSDVRAAVRTLEKLAHVCDITVEPTVFTEWQVRDMMSFSLALGLFILNWIQSLEVTGCVRAPACGRVCQSSETCHTCTHFHHI